MRLGIPLLGPEEAQSGASGRRDRAVLSWYGIGATVPESWNVVAVSGTPKQGYIRADGSAEESLEMRWQKTRRKPDLRLVAADFLKQVKRLTRKENLDYSGAARGSGREKSPDELWFEWEAGRRGIGRLIWCPDCKRTVIAQTSAPQGAGLDALAADVLGSLHDHGEGGNLEWGVYGLSFQIPSRFKLIRQRLMSGFMSMNFSAGSDRVIVERWGLAEMLMSDTGLVGWHDKEYLSELKQFRGETAALEWGEHEALRTEGVEGGFRRAVSLVRAFGVPGRSERFASVVWHCPQTNRIIGIRAFGRDPAKLATSVAASVRCHGR